MNKFKIALALTTLVLLSIAPFKSSAAPAPVPEPVKLLKGLKLQCADAKDCPANVGYMQIVTSDGIYKRTARCSAFLVAANIVATNSHCIPETVKKDPTICPSSIAIKFMPASKDKKPMATIFSCKRFLFASAMPTKLSPDYAFYEIAPTGRVAVPISQEGVEDNSRVSIVGVTPTGDGGI